MEAIKYYVKGAFVGIAETPEVLEQQEELIADLSAKVADLVADGRSQEEALGAAIASMGDLTALVREFAEQTEPFDAADAVQTVEVRASVLRLHSVAISAVGIIATLFVVSLMAAFSDALAGPAMLWDLFFGILAVGWVGWMLFKFHANPDAVEVVALDDKKRLTSTLVQWVVVCAIAFFANAAGGSGFWAWTIWVGTAAWPLSVLIEQRLIASGRFLNYAEDETCSAPVTLAGAATGGPA